MGGTDIDREQPIRLRLLDVLDRLRELRHTERNELFAHYLTAEILQDLAVPLCRDLTEIVVGGDDVDFLAELLDHPRYQRRELLLRHRTHADHAGVADTAFILVSVKIRRGGAVDDRTQRFARGRSDAADQYVDLVAIEQTAAEFLISGVVALRIEVDQLDLPPQDAARSC
ncbi:hypothetical protein ACVWWG_000785 [Bradyrhizobium sp. LB7.2]